MLTDELDFVLPPELIAQRPTDRRSDARLLHYRRADRSIVHRRFSDLPALLGSGDLLVFNDARVLPARFLLRKETGGAIEGLFLDEVEAGVWSVLLRNMGAAPVGTSLTFDREPGLTATVSRRGAGNDGGEFELRLSSREPAANVLNRVGRMPLPPYIHRHKGSDERDEEDRARYQTVYAQVPGSVAAPTAGLHFDPPLLEAIEQRGVGRAAVTLHVGMGTFKPVSADALEAHIMHRERYEISADAAQALESARTSRQRIIAVGTTAARVLESYPADVPWQATRGETGIFIYPPYRWKHVESLITNFHLPRSTLIALVAAMVGLDEQQRIYAEAIRERYRFFSYGDAMWIE